MAMSSVPVKESVKPPQTIPPNMTLRALIEQRRSQGLTMSLQEAIAVIVPVCLDVKERHDRGERLYVHPSCIAPGADGLARVDAKRALLPTHPRDRACLAPELQATLEPGDSCSTVYALGAILYEMATGEHVGPGMRRPNEINPDLPSAFDALVGKALIGDRTHRPADLGALASALYHVAPEKSIHPPDVEEAQLDQSAELDVDIRFSMLPPAERMPAIPQAARVPNPHLIDPLGQVIVPPPTPSSRRADEAFQQLGALKERLESDPRPRYVVHKDMMDHGPFSAVELLQQIASNTFVESDVLRDEISGLSQPLHDWEEFSPFTEQSKLKREVVAEEKAVVRAAAAEKKGGIAKWTVGVLLVVGIGAAATFWFMQRRGTRSDELVVAIDRGTGNLDNAGGIRGGQKRNAGGGGHGGGAGGGPGFSSGTSYESVLSGNNQEIVMGQSSGPDLTNAQLAAPLRAASFISGCGAPDDMKVFVRVAVKMGRAVGVTVSTNPSNPGVSSCVERHVRGLRWPESPKTDFVQTSY